jgi:hypothetical protein
MIFFYIFSKKIVMFLGEKDIKMMVRSKINIRMFITFEIKSQLHDKIISKSISIQGNTQETNKMYSPNTHN